MINNCFKEQSRGGNEERDTGRIHDKHTTIAREYVAGRSRIEDVFQELLTKDLRLQLTVSQRT